MFRTRHSSWIKCSLALALVLGTAACENKSSSDKASSDKSSGNLTVDSYCSAFCSKLCGTCGDKSCATTCRPPCLHGREPSMVMDGKDPKVALARTQQDLDACLATITAASCPGIMSGSAVPPACYTIQH